MEQTNQKSIYKCFIKIAFDSFFALLGIVITLPLVIVASIFIKIDSPGPVFFVHERIGYKCRKFKLYKLRTMNTRAFDDEGNKIRDRDRVTSVGRIIRKLSIDEFPQFINILKRDMSFIGPRPLLVRYLIYYTDEELKRHDVRPGITGLAQVHGRANLQWEERFEYDLEYVRNISFIQDVKILFKTIRAVLNTEGTSTIRPDYLCDFDTHRQDQKKSVLLKRTEDIEGK